MPSSVESELPAAVTTTLVADISFIEPVTSSPILVDDHVAAAGDCVSSDLNPNKNDISL